MKSVEDLDVFKMAHELALKTYATTKKFPGEETFSLVDAATSCSIPRGLKAVLRLQIGNGAVTGPPLDSLLCRRS